MSTVVVNGVEYEFYVERFPVVAFAMHWIQDAGGNIHLIKVESVFEWSASETFPSLDSRDKNHVTFMPSGGTVQVTATVTNLKTEATKEFELGLEVPGAKIDDIREEITWRIREQQRAAEKRAVQS